MRFVPSTKQPLNTLSDKHQAAILLSFLLNVTSRYKLKLSQTVTEPLNQVLIFTAYMTVIAQGDCATYDDLRCLVRQPRNEATHLARNHVSKACAVPASRNSCH